GDAEVRRDSRRGDELSPTALAKSGVALVGGDLLDRRADREEEILARQPVRGERDAEAGGDRAGGGDELGAVREEQGDVDELEAEDLPQADPLVLPGDRRERVLAAGEPGGGHRLTPRRARLPPPTRRAGRTSRGRRSDTAAPGDGPWRAGS